MHYPASFMEFITTAMYIVIFGFLWRSLAAKWHNNNVGKAMAYIY